MVMVCKDFLVARSPSTMVMVAHEMYGFRSQLTGLRATPLMRIGSSFG
jgi:hypothetical protein